MKKKLVNVNLGSLNGGMGLVCCGVVVIRMASFLYSLNMYEGNKESGRQIECRSEV